MKTGQYVTKTRLDPIELNLNVNKTQMKLFAYQMCYAMRSQLSIEINKSVYSFVTGNWNASLLTKQRNAHSTCTEFHISPHRTFVRFLYVTPGC